MEVNLAQIPGYLFSNLAFESLELLSGPAHQEAGLCDLCLILVKDRDLNIDARAEYLIT